MNNNYNRNNKNNKILIIMIMIKIILHPYFLEIMLFYIMLEPI